MSKKCTFIGNSDITPSEIIISKAKAIVIDLIEKHNVTFFIAVVIVHLIL